MNILYSSNDAFEAMAAIPLCASYLDRWPRHKDAENILEKLVESCVRTAQNEKALAAIDRYGPRMDIDRWKLDKLRLRAAPTDSLRIEVAWRIVESAGDKHVRAWAMQELATVLERSGDIAQAVGVLDRLIQEFGADPGLCSPGTHTRRQKLAGQ